MHTKDVMMCRKPVTVACDGICSKAWGVQARPKVSLSSDDDDVAWLADDELGEAPADPGTYEGGHAKPAGPAGMNKWCARECERATVEDQGRPIKLRDFTRRLFNQPWKHRQATAPGQPASPPPQ